MEIDVKKKEKKKKKGGKISSASLIEGSSSF